MATHNDELRIYAAHNQIEIVRDMLATATDDEVVDAAGDAAFEGHIECLKLLMTRLDPKAYGSLALQCAIMGRKHDCIELLYPVSNPQEALDGLKIWNPQGQWGWLEERIAEDQKQILGRAVDQLGVGGAARKL